ncbi:MAG: hypothetical protein HFI38_01060 [Lachnospiraceae bacterium]|nr:hypothetical protein [Lachnospiraceae bacterium]
MKYRFEIEEFTAKKKLPRDERYDITQYITSREIEAEDPRRAFRCLAVMTNGRLSRDSNGEQAVITLPDYGNCQLILRAVGA